MGFRPKASQEQNVLYDMTYVVPVSVNILVVCEDNKYILRSKRKWGESITIPKAYYFAK